MEYQKCSGSWSCFQRPSVTEKAHKATELQTSSWRPFSYEKSPCNCGCTYIVNGQRRVEITSGSHCTTLPLTWTIKVSVFYLFNFKSLSIIITRAKNCMKIYLCTRLCAEPCQSGTHIQRCKQNAAVPRRHPQTRKKLRFFMAQIITHIFRLVENFWWIFNSFLRTLVVAIPFSMCDKKE